MTMKNEALERPILKEFVSTNATVKDIGSMFLKNTELYNYIVALDNYCDELESRLRVGQSVVDTEANEVLPDVNGSVLCRKYKPTASGNGYCLNCGKRH
jgi:broad-specificity NMP kinase